MKHKFTVIIDVPDNKEAKPGETWTVGECVVGALKDMYEETFDMLPNDDGISVIPENEKELLDALENMVNQACGVPGSNELDSMAITDYAHAMRLLAEYGRLKITTHVGQRVIAEWVK